MKINDVKQGLLKIYKRHEVSRLGYHANVDSPGSRGLGTCKCRQWFNWRVKSLDNNVTDESRQKMQRTSAFADRTL